MASHMINKKTSRFPFSNRGASSPIKDKGSMSGTSTHFDSSNKGNSKGEHQKSNKKFPTKSKPDNQLGAVQEATDTPEDFNQVDFVPSPIITPPKIFNETYKKHSGIPKATMKNSVKSTVAKRKITGNKLTNISSYHNDKSVVTVFENKPRKVENEDYILLPSPIAEKLLSSSSATLKFNNINSSSQQRNFDYLKECDFVRNYDIYNQFEKSISSESAKSVFSLIPKLAPSSDPIVLKRRTYSCGILSVDESKDHLYETGGNRDKKELNEATMNFEFEDSDTCFYSGQSDDSDCHGDSCTPPPKKEDDVLTLKKPVKIKCFDESADQMKEIILFSEEFLSNILKEKGSGASKKEVFESLLQQSTVYEGKSLRVISDTKIFYDNLQTSTKSQGDIKCTDTIKTTQPTSPKGSSKVTQTKKTTDASRRKCCETLPARGQTNKRKQKSPQKRDASKKTDVQIGTKRQSSSQAQTQIPVRKKSAKSVQSVQSKQEDEKSEPGDGRKSRTALKRINVEEIIASGFSQYFHFYAKLGGRLKSGACISRKNSTLWLRRCGLVNDNISEQSADACFMTMARTKYILNISDYVQYLIKIARKKHMFLVDIIQQLMSVDPRSLKKPNSELKANHFTDKAEQTAKLYDTTTKFIEKESD